MERFVSAPCDRRRCLFIDLGHSRVKWAYGAGGQIAPDSADACPTDELAPLLARLERADFDQLWWSPQGHADIVAQLTRQFDQLGLSCLAVTNGSLALPVAPAYPQLGSDRWLALQWPHQATPGPLCVVDCGTAVTVDLLDHAGRHLGGWIMAGMAGLERGLGASARQLPAARSGPALEAIQPATDSARAIGRGLQLQLIGGIRAALDQAERLLSRDRPSKAGTDTRGRAKPSVWLTGGDAGLVEQGLERPLRHDPHLVLRGLALAEQQHQQHHGSPT